jgi:hypothetical protein
MMKRLSYTLTLLFAIACQGCTSLTAVRATSEIPGNVRVWFESRDHEVFKLVVLNQSPQVVTVDRNAVTLVHAGEEQHRVPGGASTLYTLMPGAAHKVNVRFRLSDIVKGETVCIQLRNAVFVGGTPIEIPPLQFIAD